ncbi:MAG: hypothetical protein ACRD2U_14915 [Terriglobales bacterium]
MSRLLTACLLGILAFAISLSPASAQQLAKRLILKDGSYQPVTKYEIHGDRVHYFSAERNEWEDVPNSLVDWDATAKFEKDRAAGSPVPEAVQLDREMAAERQADEARSPEVSPGLRLPEDGQVYLLDTFQNAANLVELQESDAELNRDTKHNILRAAIDPIASSKQTIELPGLHSRIQAHVTLPSIYVRAQDEASPAQQKSDKTASPNREKSPAESWDRFRIVRLQPKQDKRIIGNIKVAVYGKVTQQQDFVSAKVQPLTGGWIKITPSNDLTDGEYALVEMMDKGELSSAVWDFGINPSAPPNAMVVTAQPRKSVEKDQRFKELQTRKPD